MGKAIIRYYKKKRSLIKYDKLWVEAGIGREEGNAKGVTLVWGMGMDGDGV
jgi:uncharacterized protein VirK/YbjX